jgi:4-hydroxy-4-methyl-2-oxoglutarate aldolase
MTELLAKLAHAATANVSDVLGSMVTMHPDICAIVPGKRLIGRAFTVKAYPGSIITVHKALTEAAVGDVIIVAGEGDVRAGALLGEIMALECQTRGFAGVVIDGAVRDVQGLREQGYPVFARGVTPRVGTNRRLGQTQIPVSCGGLVIHPGDLIFGDDDGVVAIPQNQELELAAALDALLAKEAKLVAGIQEGRYLAETLGFENIFRDG